MRSVTSELSTAVSVLVDIAVVRGGGHVDLPLSIALADRGARVGVYDVDPATVSKINSGMLPFREPGAAPVLALAVAEGRLHATMQASVVAA